MMIQTFSLETAIMAPRKPATTLLNDAETSGDPSAPLASNSSPPLTRRDAAKLRQVSLKQAAVLLNRDRNTVQKYLDQGCPFVEKADRERGLSWVLDIGDVVKWLEDRAAKNVATRMGDGKDGQMTEDDAKRRLKSAQALQAELDYAENANIVARIHDMLDLVRRDYGEISLRLKAIPDTLAAKVDAKLAEKVRKTAYELIANTLTALAAPAEIEKIASVA